MKIDQIRYYFKVIEKMTRKYFYTKQWKKTKNIYKNNVIIRQSDYPVNKNWRQIYARECKVQNLFFEELYDLS